MCADTNNRDYKMTVKILEQPSTLVLPIAEMLCDKPLGDVPKPFNNQSHALGIFGPPRSGKSVMIQGILGAKKPNQVFRKRFNKIYLFQPQNSRGSVKKSVFDTLDDDQVYDDLDAETLGDVYEKIKINAEEGLYSLIVLDDMATSLKQNDVQQLLCNICNNRRHYKTTLWIVAQSYISIPRPVRKVLSEICVFKSNNKLEYESIWNEMLFLPKDVGEALIRYVYKAPHDMLYLNADGEMYRNFAALTLEY